MGDVILDYFIRPVIERTGYNAINTLTYAAIALVAVYLIWRWMRKNGVDFSSKPFLYSVASFVLFGATARVVTDLSDAGAISAAAASAGALAPVYSALDASGIFHYGYLTVTPGIYIVTAILFLLSFAMGRVMKNPMFASYAGFALFLPCALLLLPFIKHLDYALLVLALAGAASFIAWKALERFGGVKTQSHGKLAILGQALDGAATFVVLDIFSAQTGKKYFEQHVLSSGIGELTPLGFGLFFLVKVVLASLIVYFINKEKMVRGDVALVLIVVAIMGFAPGIRNLLRMLAGT